MGKKKRRTQGPPSLRQACRLLGGALAKGLHRLDLHLLNHIVLDVENIDIILLDAHARAGNRDLFQRLQNNPVNRSGLIFRQMPVKRFIDFAHVALPSMMTVPSVNGVTSSASVGDIEVVKSPTISSRISSTVTSPWMSPYSSTTRPTFFLLRWNFTSCVLSGVPSGTK